MAERRMFAKAIVNSARFLRMPPTSRLLYYDLGMAADDDGVVEAFTVMRTTGATDDDLRVLTARGFVRILNDDLVSHILDWKQNNQIRSDRYKPSIYSSLLVQLSSENHSEKSADNQRFTVGIPDGNQTGGNWETQERVGKARVVQERGEENSSPPSLSSSEGFRLEIPTEKYAKKALSAFTPTNADDLRKFHDTKGLSEELIRHAIDEACAKGKPSWGYCHQILSRYVTDGIRSVEEVKPKPASETSDVKWWT